MFSRHYYRTYEIKPNLCLLCESSPFYGMVGVLFRHFQFPFSSSQPTHYLFIIWIFQQLLVLRPMLKISQFKHLIYSSITEGHPNTSHIHRNILHSHHICIEFPCKSYKSWCLVLAKEFPTSFFHYFRKWGN